MRAEGTVILDLRSGCPYVVIKDDGSRLLAVSLYDHKKKYLYRTDDRKLLGINQDYAILGTSPYLYQELKNEVNYEQ